jgi:branched-chain amino acid transport system substrate-binding protein
MNRKISISLAVIVLVMLVLIGFNYKKNTTPITIGFVSSLSGNAAAWGEPLKAGFDFAIKETNSAGGINNNPVSVIYEDDKCEPATGLTVFKKLIDIDKVKFIAGSVCSSVAMSVAKTTQENRVLYIASGATSPEVPKQGDLIFRLWVSDAYEAKANAQYAINKLGNKTFSIGYFNDNPAGEALRQNFQNEALQLGAKINSTESYNSKTQDFRTVLAK